MQKSKLAIDHIEIDPDGRPWIAGTRTKVVEVIMDQMAHGWSPEEIHFQHYGDLGMAQIHSAFAFYYDNQALLDAQIQELLGESDQVAGQLGESPLRRRLRLEGKLG